MEKKNTIHPKEKERLRGCVDQSRDLDGCFLHFDYVQFSLHRCYSGTNCLDKGLILLTQ